MKVSLETLVCNVRIVGKITTINAEPFEQNVHLKKVFTSISKPI